MLPFVALQALKPVQVGVFARVLRDKLLTNKGFAKRYLQALVSQIRLEGRELRIGRSNAVLAQAVAQTKLDCPAVVPTFDRNWLAKPGKSENRWVETVALTQLT